MFRFFNLSSSASRGNGQDIEGQLDDLQAKENELDNLIKAAGKS